MYLIGHNVVTWPHLAAWESEKCCLYSRQPWTHSKIRSFVTTEKGKVNLEMGLMVSATVVEWGLEQGPPTLFVASSPNPISLLLLNPQICPEAWIPRLAGVLILSF